MGLRPRGSFCYDISVIVNCLKGRIGMFSCRKPIFATSVALVTILAGCASKAPLPAPPAKSVGVQCQAVSAGDPLVGTWLSIRKEKGIVGEMRTLFILKPDGQMSYVEQLKRGRQPPQELTESGCWSHNTQTLGLRTTKSNGEPVDLNDPIYKNRYAITSQAGTTLALKGSDGAIRARRMPDGYRLPF